MSKASTFKTTLFLLCVLLIFAWATYTSNLTLFLQSQQRIGANQDPESVVVLPIINVSECNSGDCVKNSIARRLQDAESNWNRANERRQKAMMEVSLQNGVDSNRAQILWDFFYPSFDCPFTKERIGRVGDGGKWICGFDQLGNKSQCVVFSFGVRGDTSFEEEILRRTQNCIVHMFDHTVPDDPHIVVQFPGRAHFHRMGIGSENMGNLKTLKSIMEMYEIQILDILKMDVEGSEWEAMRRILEDFNSTLPFGQIQIEVHLNNFGASDWLQILNTWWNKLESAGLRSFFREPNLLNSMRYEFRELAFLNIKLEPFKF